MPDIPLRGMAPKTCDDAVGLLARVHHAARGCRCKPLPAAAPMNPPGPGPSDP